MTVSELMSVVITAGSFLGALAVIGTTFGFIVKWMLKPMYKELRREDVRSCRMFLVGFLCDIEKGIEKDEVEWKLAYEIYDHYSNELQENSYVHDKWERVVNHE